MILKIRPAVFEAMPNSGFPPQATHSLFRAVLKDSLDKRISQAIFGPHHFKPRMHSLCQFSRHFKSMNFKHLPSPHPKNPEYENQDLFGFS
jgi:hypothetical protein